VVPKYISLSLDQKRKTMSCIFIGLFSIYYLQVRYVMRCIFGEAKNAPLVRLTGKSLVSAIWKGDNSIVSELFN
jgi:hypothetical protein